MAVHAHRVAGLRSPAQALSLRDHPLAVAVGASSLVAACLVLAMPRGPVTAHQALAALLAGLALGGATGYLMRSRWAMLVGPVAVVVAFELRWIWADGPTVDAPALGTSYGILALVLGRGFFFLVFTVPALLGAAVGAGLARRAPRPARLRGRVGLYARRTVTALVAVLVAATAYGIARPGSTPAIAGPDSIATLEQVSLPGGDQWISIRGHSEDNPVLLYLEGGPIQSGLPFARFLFAGLERDFVVVDWDQRGTGKSHAALEPLSTYTVDGLVEDTAALSRYLAERFDERKIYLVGTSWGSTLGVLTAQRHPELFHAFVSGGQMVSQRETDVRIYRDLLAAGDDAVVAKLRSLGPPPYDSVFSYGYVMQHYPDVERDYDFIPAVERVGEEHFRELGPWGVFGREYDLVEKVNVMRGLIESFAALYPQLQDVDFRRDVPRLDVPVYMLRGTGELAARDDLAVAWFWALQAPRKRMYVLDHAGHAVLTERPDRLRAVLTGTVVPETYDE